MATMRLRLTAYSLAGLEAPDAVRHGSHHGTAYVRAALSEETAHLAGFYERVASLVGRPVAHQVLLPVTVPAFVSLDENGSTIVLGEADRIGEAGGSDGADGTGDEPGTNLVRLITAPHHPHLLWVHEHLQHLRSHAQAIADPASHVAEQRRLPWWR